MIKTLFIISVAMILSFTIIAQDTIQKPPPPKEKPQKPKAPMKDKIYFGGNVGLTIGNYTRIAVYPLVGYKFTPKLSGGLKIVYEYISDNRYSSKYNTSNYGGSLFARYRVIPSLYAHVEYAQINYELYNFNGESVREWIPFLFVGAGYSQKMGGNAWLNFQVLFDVLQSDKSPYQEWAPFYSIGVGVGF